MKTKFMICYDISKDRIRYRVARILLGYGIRSQKSIFEVEEDKKNVNKLMNELSEIILHGTDKIFSFEISDRGTIERRGDSVEYLACDDFYI